MDFYIRWPDGVVRRVQRGGLRNIGGLALVSMLFFLLLSASPMVHAQSTTTISTLPYQIATPGAYVLAGDLTFDASNAPAVSIQAGNVILDCNGHRISSLNRIPDLPAVSAAVGLSDVSIRNCTVVNFDRGITAGWRGYRTQIVDNQILNGGSRGITILGSDALVSGNRIIGLRSKPAGVSEGIWVREFDTGILSANIRVFDNVVADVIGDVGARGIVVGQSSAPQIVGNTLMDIRANPAYSNYAYYLFFPEMAAAPYVENALVRQNVMMARTLQAAYAPDRVYAGQVNAAAACRDNVSVGFRVIDYSVCQVPDRNVDIP